MAGAERIGEVISLGWVEAVGGFFDISSKTRAAANAGEGDLGDVGRLWVLEEDRMGDDGVGID